MSCTRYLFDPNARVESLQLASRLQGHNGVVPDDEQDRDVDGAHHLAILGIGRCEDVERAHPGLQPGVGQEFDDLGRTMRMSGPCLS